MNITFVIAGFQSFVLNVKGFFNTTIQDISTVHKTINMVKKFQT